MKRETGIKKGAAVEVVSPDRFDGEPGTVTRVCQNGEYFAVRLAKLGYTIRKPAAQLKVVPDARR